MNFLKVFVFPMVLGLLIALPLAAQAKVYELEAQDADLSEAPNIIVEPENPPFNLGGWREEPQNVAKFSFIVDEAGPYKITLLASRALGGSTMVDVWVGDDYDGLVQVPVEYTGTWADYQTFAAAKPLTLPAGEVELRLAGNDHPFGGYLLNLRTITLEPATQSATPAAAAAPAPFWAELDKLGADQRASVKVDPQALVGKWVDRNNPMNGDVLEIHRADYGAFSSRERKVGLPFGISWSDADAAFMLSGTSRGALRLIQLDGKNAIAISLHSDDNSFNLLMQRPVDIQGLKVYSLIYDGFDWGRASQPGPDGDPAFKLKMAADIIAVWKQYNETVNAPQLLTAQGLVDALDAPDTFESKENLFHAACDVAGVDFDSYVYADD